MLANGLMYLETEAALSVREAQIATLQRFWPGSVEVLKSQADLANCLTLLGRFEKALPIFRAVYNCALELRGATHPDTIIDACNYVNSLLDNRHFTEAKQLARLQQRLARPLSERNRARLEANGILAQALFQAFEAGDPGSTRADLLESEVLIADAVKIMRHTVGAQHKESLDAINNLAVVRQAIADTPPGS